MPRGKPLFEGLSSSIYIEGLSDLLETMSRLPRQVEDNQVRASMVPAGMMMRDIAKAIVVRRTGLLSEAIRLAFAKQESSQNKKVYHIFVSRRVKKVYPKGARTDKYADKPIDPFYFHLIELGSNKMSAKPFLRPAFDSSVEKAANMIIEKLWDGIEKEVKALKR